MEYVVPPVAEDIVRQTLESDDPEWILLTHVRDLERAGHPAAICQVFELFSSHQEVTNYWTIYIAMNAYSVLGDQDGAFRAASRANDIDPTSSGAPRVASVLFHYLHNRGEETAAAKIFFSHLRLYGETVWDADTVHYAKYACIDLSEGVVDKNWRITHEIYPASIRPAWQPALALGGPASGLAALNHPQEHRAIVISMLPESRLIIHRGSFAVQDRAGLPHSDISVTANAPLALWLRNGAAPDMFEQYDAEDVVVISDRWWHPNLCHFLLDHTKRLHLYERAGVDLSQALVITPEIAAKFQYEMLEIAGIKNYLTINRLAEVRAKRLWVSSECRDLQLSGHGGARWAFDYARATYGTVAKPSRRLFISRRDAGSRLFTNESEIADLLERKGFERVAMSEMSFRQQVSTFAEATHVIGAHGAALALTSFSAPGIHLAEIFHPFFTNTQIATIAAPLGLKYTSIVGCDFEYSIHEMTDPNERARLYASQSWQYRDIHVAPHLVVAWLKFCGVW